MKNKTKWIIGFLGIIGLTVVLELISAFDNSEDTRSLTQIIVEFIPSWIGFPLIFLFSGWLVYHFYKFYKKRNI
jgi:hypothetical protein